MFQIKKLFLSNRTLVLKGREGLDDFTKKNIDSLVLVGCEKIGSFKESNIQNKILKNIMFFRCRKEIYNHMIPMCSRMPNLEEVWIYDNIDETIIIKNIPLEKMRMKYFDYSCEVIKSSDDFKKKLQDLNVFEEVDNYCNHQNNGYYVNF